MKKIVLFLFFLLPFSLLAQKKTEVSGRIIDAVTGEELPFVNVSFEGKNIGTSTDLKGNFKIGTLWASDAINVSFIGYTTQKINIKIGEKNKFSKILLVPSAVQLTEIVVRPKRVKYQRKHNPAVDLMRQVIANKNKNSIESRQYYEFESYEKLEFSLNNINPKMKDKKSMRNFQFMFSYVDTSALNGKPYLPVFIKETISDKYYRKSPALLREEVKASKVSGFDKYFDNAGMSSYLELLFKNINIYDNDIAMLNQQFVSPLSNIATSFYKFYLLDTVEIGGIKCNSVTFIPQNSADWGFSGTLYITADSTFAVKKVELNILKKTSLNFVDDMRVVQEFKQVDGTWVLSRDEIMLDFNLFDLNQGVYGKRTSMYKDYVFDKARPKKDYQGARRIVRLDDATEKSTDYWASARHVSLSTQEQGIYKMLDTLNNVKQFQNFMNLIQLVTTGYIELGKIDFGPVPSMYSYNNIEGHRFRVGAKTNAQLHPKLFFDGYLAYGTKDKQIKSFGALSYSLNKKKHHQWEYPMNMFTLSYENNTKIPGQRLNHATSDNVLFSLNRGVVDKMVYNKNIKLQYDLEMKGGWGLKTAFSVNKQRAAGALNFANFDASGILQTVDALNSTELGLSLRYAPNEEFYQNKRYRMPITKKEPVFTLTHNMGLKNVFNSDYKYHNTHFSVEQRIWLSSFGYVDALARVGKVWGQASYPFLFVHNANQTYAYHKRAYNMMNFLEFVSDKYASIDLAYHMQGLVFNRVPLLKKLKWREILTFKALWAGVGKNNLPHNNPSLLMFPTNEDGNASTFVLGKTPYMEGSVGIDNIFKILRFDLVWRMSYRNNPNVDKLGIRFKFHVNF